MTGLDVIRFEGVSKRFGDVVALDGVSFAVGEGEVFGYVGPNGAGKTTTIRVMLGLVKPDKGRVYIFGRDVEGDESFRWRVGAVLDRYGLYDDLTAFENLEFFGKIYGLSKEERRERIDCLLRIVGLESWRDKPVGPFSKGMKQRLAVARALIHEPSIVVFDEPTAGLDPDAQVQVRRMIRELTRGKGCTVFFTSHNLYEVEELCDRIAIIKGGRILALGSLEDLRRVRRCVYIASFGDKGEARRGMDIVKGFKGATVAVRDASVYFSLPDGVEPRDVVKALVSAGLGVREFYRREAGLYEIYREVVDEAER